MMKSLILFLALATPLLAVYQYPDCSGTINESPVIDQAPKLVETVNNGKKYLIESTNNTKLTVIAVKGSSYQMGYAYGQLMKDDLKVALPGMINYLVQRVDELLVQLKDILPFYLKWIPNLLELAPKELLYGLLDLTGYFTKKHTPKRFVDEMKGIADATGIDEKLIVRLNLFPELIRAQCSIAGVWGPASADGNLLQLRALDWEFNAFIVNYPLAVLYFPDEANSNPFASFGFTGLVGAISGYSNKVAISEKVWLPISTDPKSFYGEPFTYVLRDLLQFGNDLASTTKILFETPKTCKIHAGIGSRADNSFLGVQMSFKDLDIFDDKNYTNYSESHPQIDGVMYWDKHIQPSKNKCLGSILKENQGKIDAEFIWRQVAGIHQTGDTQIVVYDFKRETVYLSYSDPQAMVKAFYRPIISLNMKELLDPKTHF